MAKNKPAPNFMDEPETPTETSTGAVAMMPDGPPRQAAVFAMPAGAIPCPAPGLYPGVPFETYVKWHAVNHSTLKKVLRSPRHFRHALEHHDDSTTPSKRFGTAGHELLLEPARFKSRVVIGPVNEKTGKCYGSETKAWAEFEAAHPGKLVVSHEALANLEGVARAMNAHPGAGTLLAATGLCECCMVWDDKITGLRCKARVDKLIPEYGRIDFKTCESAAAPAFSKALIDYGYHTQDAFYEMGLRAMTELEVWTGKERSGFIACESASPHAVAVFEIGQDTLGIGRNLVREWLCKVRECIERNEWPAYPESAQVIDAPPWYFKQFAHAMDE